MRPWVLVLPVDRGLYRIDLRTRTYEYLGRNPAWRELPIAKNARNRRQLHGLRRVFRDGTTKVFTDPAWPYAEDHPCPTCYSWIPRDSPCDHRKYECPACGRRQCLLHWRYPMRTAGEARHFLRAAEAQTGKACFVRAVHKRRRDRVGTVWKIFTSEEDHQASSTTCVPRDRLGQVPPRHSAGDAGGVLLAGRRISDDAAGLAASLNCSSPTATAPKT